MIAVADKPSPPPAPQVLGDDADTAFDFPVKLWRTTEDAAPMPSTIAPSSIFDLAATALALKTRGRFGDAAGFEARPPRPTVVRQDGVVRVVGGQYPANRWDAGREEQERQRRARQKPPRPTKKAKTRGKKVRRWDGEEFE